MSALHVSNALAGLPPLTGRKGRHAVFLVQVADSFQPSDPTEVPDWFSDPELLANRLGVKQGVEVLRTVNRHAIENDLADGRWAILVFRPKSKGGQQP